MPAHWDSCYPDPTALRHETEAMTRACIDALLEVIPRHEIEAITSGQRSDEAIRKVVRAGASLLDRGFAVAKGPTGVPSQQKWSRRDR